MAHEKLGHVSPKDSLLEQAQEEKLVHLENQPLRPRKSRRDSTISGCELALEVLNRKQ